MRPTSCGVGSRGARPATSPAQPAGIVSAERLQSLRSATLLAGHGGGVVCGNPFDLSTMRCLAIARVASHHAVLIQCVHVASTARTIPTHYALFIRRRLSLFVEDTSRAAARDPGRLRWSCARSNRRMARALQLHGATTCHQATNTGDGFVPGLAT